MAVEGIAQELGVSSSATPFLIETDQSLSRHGVFAQFVRDADEGEIDHVKADDIEFAVAGREASEALEPVEEALDQVSGPVGARSTRSTITRADAPSDTLWRVGTPAAPQAPARYATAGWRFRFLLALVGLLIALVSGLLTKDIASADDRETVLTHLRPGDNYVGWISDSQPVQMLFAQLPQIEVIWAWNASRQQFMLAAPTVPSQLWTLHTLEPGMGLILRFGGESVVKWARERGNAEAVVQLASGYNLVGWMGEDQTSLRQALGGIGRPLRGAGIWSTDAETMVYRTGDELQRSRQSPPVPLGAAFWVNVEHPTYWLQSRLAPTHIHWFTHPEVNTDRNKQGSATIQYGGGSFYQLISRLSVEGCEVITLKTGDLEYDLRHSHVQNRAFKAQYTDSIDPHTEFRVECVNNCDVAYVGSSASEHTRDWAGTMERCIPWTNVSDGVDPTVDFRNCNQSWSTEAAHALRRIPVFQDLCLYVARISSGFVGGMSFPNILLLNGQAFVQHWRSLVALLIPREDSGIGYLEGRSTWLHVTLHEICHSHQYWYIFRFFAEDARLRKLTDASPIYVALFYDTDMGRDFIDLAGFEEDSPGHWILSGRKSVKGADPYVESDPLELAADVCSLYMLKRLIPDDLGHLDSYTKPPYLTEELERWVEQYVVLPE